MNKLNFDGKPWVAQLPIHLAERISQLTSQAAMSGEHATANETVAVIETTFGYLGRLWVAEYVYAGAVDAAINRDLLDLSCRPILTGRWVSLARRIRGLFSDQSLPTVVSGLPSLDFGSQDDATHPVTRLIAYRNSFSHGSYSAVVEDIRAHRLLIEQLIASLPALWQQPIHSFTDENGAPRLAVQGWPLASVKTAHSELGYHPFIIGADGQTHLPIYPLLHVALTQEGLVLRTGDGKGRQHTLETLFERETLRLWHGRYLREQQGHLSFDAVLRARSNGQLTPAVFSTVREALSSPGLARLIVEAHPGCGKVDLVAHFEQVSPRNTPVVTAAYMIDPGGLSQSGLTFARFLLRRAEAALGLAEDILSCDKLNIPAALASAEMQLSAAGIVLLVGVEDLHLGITASQTESFSVADVFALPSGKAIQLLGTVYPSRTSRRLPCDQRIVLPVPAPTGLAIDELHAAFSVLCPATDKLGQRVLLELLKIARPVSLFELCEALDRTEDAVFEPAVERTLWRLRPLLVLDDVGTEHRWQALAGLCHSWFSGTD